MSPNDPTTQPGEVIFNHAERAQTTLQRQHTPSPALPSWSCPPPLLVAAIGLPELFWSILRFPPPLLLHEKQVTSLLL